MVVSPLPSAGEAAAPSLLQALFSPFAAAFEPSRNAPSAMAKKRKRTDAPTEAVAAEKPDDSAPERPPRTLFGFKEPPPDAEPASAAAGSAEAAAAPPFRNKEKVLITCSRRITYRWVLITCSTPLLPCRSSKYPVAGDSIDACVRACFGAGTGI